ncbi:MAG: N-acetyl-gamma-glutamyl-phosphate reductase [Candidatus Promineifilaceae bacterium]|nr:N-acetyl-gamma-glutamyl-phosphate reductase [Candidatus Promineifilaceae bacterium]
MVNVGVFGATGYTGWELVSILDQHLEVEISFATSKSYAGKSLRHLYPSAPDLALIAPEDAPLDATAIVFLCLPHAAAANTAVLALDSGNKVIDLSADFRLRDPVVYEKWYGVTHPAPQLLEEAVYGLTEFARDELAQTRLVANPGCYTTTTLLALQPLMAAQVNVIGDVIIDAKSGVSGAGRAPKDNTHFVQVADNFSPYKIGRTHRHLPEMEQVISWWHESPPRLIFSPHLLPVPRGILANIYVSLGENWSEPRVRQLYDDTYRKETFVEILPSGELATLAHVTHSNRCVISLTFAEQMLIITSATDNLVKGAAGQAVQNMNVMLGLKENTGLN